MGRGEDGREEVVGAPITQTARVTRIHTSASFFWCTDRHYWQLTTAKGVLSLSFRQ